MMGARYGVMGQKRVVKQARDSWASLDVLNLIGFEDINDESHNSQEEEPEAFKPEPSSTTAISLEDVEPGTELEAPEEVEAPEAASPRARRNAMGLKQMREMLVSAALGRKRIAGVTKSISFNTKSDRNQKRPLFTFQRQQRSRQIIA